MFDDFYARRLVRAANDTAVNATMEKEPIAAPSSVLPLGFGVISFIVFFYKYTFWIALYVYTIHTLLVNHKLKALEF